MEKRTEGKREKEDGKDRTDERKNAKKNPELTLPRETHHPANTMQEAGSFRKAKE